MLTERAPIADDGLPSYLADQVPDELHLQVMQREPAVEPEIASSKAIRRISTRAPIVVALSHSEQERADSARADRAAQL